MAGNRWKIKVEAISKSFEDKNSKARVSEKASDKDKIGKISVLNDVSFQVYENEFLVILGPGQCGKTVLLNILAGMEEKDCGNVKFDNNQTRVGFVFQKYALYNWKTVIKNVELPLKFKGVGKKERRKIAQKYIDLVGLTGFENKYPAQISGGMKQRVGIARAYSMGSDIIFMDEPFGALDAQTRYQMQDELLRMKEKEKKTIVFVTNNIEEAIYLGDRILLFSNKPSKVVKEYVPELERPRNNASKEFMELRNVITEEMDLSL